MKNYLMLLALGLVLSLGSGCAASLSPIPGMSVGFDLAPDNFGVGIEVDPLVTGCKVAGVISWNWAENMFCKEGFVAPEVSQAEGVSDHKFVTFGLIDYAYGDSNELAWNSDFNRDDGMILFQDGEVRGSTLYEGTESISFETPEMVLFPRN